MDDLTKKKALDDDLRNQAARGPERILGQLQGGAGGGKLSGFSVQFSVVS